MKRSIVIFVVLMFAVASKPVNAQAVHSDSEELWLQVDASTFFRDAEFFMPFAKGYSAAGFWFTPTLCYSVYDYAQVRAGVRMVGVAGTEGLYQVQPVFGIDFYLNHWLTLTLGTIDATKGHNVGDPIYDRERWYYHDQEDGMQIKTNTEHWTSDTWLDWEHFLEPWTADQERFTAGTRQLFTLRPDESLFNVSLPLAFSGSHRGGQISTLDTCIETLFNESVGLVFSYDNHADKKVSLSLPAYFFQNNSPTVHTKYEQGWGFYPQLSFEKQFVRKDNTLEVNVGYWYGYQYLSARGGALFHCYSPFDASYVDPYRNMVTMGVSLRHSVPCFDLTLDAEGYYDMLLSEFDFVIGLNLRFSNAWLLWSGR